MNIFLVILIIVISILIVLGVISCLDIDKIIEKEPEIIESYFKIVKQFPGYSIVYHPTTKVMYIHCYSSSGAYSFTQLVNSDGSPMIWKE